MFWISLSSTWNFALELQYFQCLILVLGHPHLVLVYNCTNVHWGLDLNKNAHMCFNLYFNHSLLLSVVHVKWGAFQVQRIYACICLRLPLNDPLNNPTLFICTQRWRGINIRDLWGCLSWFDCLVQIPPPSPAPTKLFSKSTRVRNKLYLPSSHSFWFKYNS